MKSYRGTSAQCGWCPYEKRRSGHRHTQRDSHVRTWRGDGHLHAKERGPWRHWPCLDFQPPDWETICCLSHPLHGPLSWKPRQTWTMVEVLSMEDAPVAILRPRPSSDPCPPRTEVSLPSCWVSMMVMNPALPSVPWEPALSPRELPHPKPQCCPNDTSTSNKGLDPLPNLRQFSRVLHPSSETSCESAGVTAHILHPSPTLAFTLWTKK